MHQRIDFNRVLQTMPRKKVVEHRFQNFRRNEKKLESIFPEFRSFEVDPNFFNEKNAVINIFGSPQPGQARKNLGIKRNKRLFTNSNTGLEGDDSRGIFSYKNVHVHPGQGLTNP